MTSGIIGWIVSALKATWCWFLGICADFLTLFVDGLFATLPSLDNPYITAVAQWIPVANSYLPIAEGVIALGVWGTVKGTLLAYRFCKSFLWGS